ncbi:MAG: chromosome segregation ATPase [Cyanobacteria bacterium SBLK]|nr:chromosome segregation ATPase [Cyanobacteria bacterium SBLK]
MNQPPKRPDRPRRSEKRPPSSTNGGERKRDRNGLDSPTDGYRDRLYRTSSGTSSMRSSKSSSMGSSSQQPRKTQPFKTPPKTTTAKTSPSKFSTPPKPASKFANPPQKPPIASASLTESSPPKKSWNWLFGWQLWGSFVVLVSGTTGFAAMALLLKLPAVPNCPEMFLPTASASMRLYCAQVAANKQDAENLLYAIQLVQNLPSTHPLRPEIDRVMEGWVTEALRWGEDKYQAGELDEAIALARQVALRFHNKTLIEERIARWRETWSQAEKIEGEIEDHLERSAWGQAFQAAAKLTKLNNSYWGNTRYDQWYERLNLARQESQKLDKAFAQLHRGGLDNLLKAIALAEEVSPDSSAYAEARSLVGEAADRLVDLAFQKLKTGDWQGAIEVANSIPGKLGLNDEIVDINSLADAASTAGYGSIANLEDAIALAREIAPGRPLYSRSQALIRQWQTEIEGISNLAQADRLAREGSASAFKAAIAQARLIPANNPRYSEARDKISRWQRRVETLQARSAADRNIQLASAASQGNSPFAFNPRLPAAPSSRENPPVNNRSQPNRSTSQPTRPTSQPTRSTPQVDLAARNRDRSLLDEAVSLANQGRYSEAIQTLGQIDEESSLYFEARNRRDRWQNDSRSQVTLARAYQQAATRTPNSLRAAIDTARTIPPNSQVAVQSQQAIASWSAEILSLARGESGRNLEQAIAIARQVPANTPSYDTARSQIAVWQDILQNPPVPTLNKPPRESENF